MGVNRDVLIEAIGPLPFPSFWTLDELARLLGIDLAEVKAMARRNELPRYFVGGRYLVSSADLIRWLLLQRSVGGSGDGRTWRR